MFLRMSALSYLLFVNWEDIDVMDQKRGVHDRVKLSVFLKEQTPGLNDCRLGRCK